MTGDEFKDWMERRGYTVSSLCKDMGLSPKNCRAYLRRGARNVPRLVSLAVGGLVMERNNRPEWDR